MLLKNDQMQFSEKHEKFRDGEKPYYFMVKMVFSNHSYLRKVLEIESIPNEQMDESHAWIPINFWIIDFFPNDKDHSCFVQFGVFGLVDKSFFSLGKVQTSD